MSTLVEALGPAQYVAAVRRELGDLGPDEVEELTGGLEADLVDALTESREMPEALFGPPAVYAAELRSAAGLPARPQAEKPPAGSRERLRRQLNLAEKWLDAQSYGPDVRAFAVTARPLWWAFRALVVSQIIVYQLSSEAGWLPYRISEWLLFLILLVVSVEVGRRKIGERDALRRYLVKGTNVLAGFVLFLASLTLLFDGQVGVANSPEPGWGDASAVSIASESSPGVTNAGSPVRNIFAYDSEGNLLENVQLFDDQGRRMEPGETSYEDEEYNYVELVPSGTVNGQERFNVYPLQERVEPYSENGEPLREFFRAPRAPGLKQYPVTPLAPAPETTATAPSEMGDE